MYKRQQRNPNTPVQSTKPQFLLIPYHPQKMQFKSASFVALAVWFAGAANASALNARVGPTRKRRSPTSHPPHPRLHSLRHPQRRQRRQQVVSPPAPTLPPPPRSGASTPSTTGTSSNSRTPATTSASICSSTRSAGRSSLSRGARTAMAPGAPSATPSLIRRRRRSPGQPPDRAHRAQQPYSFRGHWVLRGAQRERPHLQPLHRRAGSDLVVDLCEL
ncbi:hypothetical protein B0H13DRAFT_2168514, partial [Mycena leptocephala]